MLTGINKDDAKDVEINNVIQTMLTLKRIDLFVCPRGITYWVKSVARESMFCVSRWHYLGI